jgi:hypothetical protein
MFSNFTMITVPQWAIFTATTVLIYGWVEHKRAFGMVGSGIFVALGIFAAWVIYAGLLVPESLFDTRELMDGEELFMPDELPIEGRLLPFYWGMSFNALVALAALIAEARNHKSAGFLKIAATTIGLLLFFGMLGAAGM